MSSWGYGPMQDSNAQMITYIILGLIGEYVSGQYKQRWYARGGQFAFPSLQAFSLPSASAYTPSTSGTPTPVSTSAPAQPAYAPAQPAYAPAQPVYAPAQPAPSGYTSIGPAPNGQMLYMQTGNPSGPMYTYSNGMLSVYGSPAGSTPQQSSAVPVPAGFVLVGAANNLPAYQGPDGFYYSWSGTVMSPLTGVLQTASGQSAQVNAGALYNAAAQPPPSSLTTNSQAGVSPYASGASSAYVPYTAPSTPIATIQPLSAAGVGTGALPSWLTWGAVASVVGMMVMSARPAPASTRAPARRRR